jgi:preprotein translocase subunit SecA
MSDVHALGALPADLAPGRPYVERHESEPPWHDRFALALWRALPAAWRPGAAARVRVPGRLVADVHRHAAEVAALSDTALRDEGLAVGRRLRRLGFDAATSARCFAVVGEAAHRTLGKRPYDSQLRAAWSLLQGALVEMATGEGKTFAATLPACAVALAGVTVHVVTVNDYLAERDAVEMGPLYRFFGLDVGIVVQGMQRPQRQAAYARPITYCTNKELAFDYLRDRTALGDRSSRLHLALDTLRGRDEARRDGAVAMRGLAYCIVDEADSVFVDEARTPLILSATNAAGGAAEDYLRALDLAARMEAGTHYVLDERTRRVQLLPAAYDWLDAAVEQGGADAAAREPGSEATGDELWASPRRREELVQQAVSARAFYLRDRHYVVTDGKVQIVDESTGRVMPDRAWERGLHQMIEAKEGVALTGQRETLARITYQRLFRRYVRLAGMSGTAKEVAGEIGRVYGLDVVRVPLHRPSRRRLLPSRCLRDAAAKWQAVADVAVDVAGRQQRPLLIGTRSVDASEQLSAVLHARGIEHVVLNAKQDQGEAEIIALAGQPGRVTVATNMAGRGTDIMLGAGVAERGGLHVVLTEFHDSARIDRQLIGRCARQGDPGSAQAIVALDDTLFTTQLPVPVKEVAARAPVGGLALFALRRLAQWRAERHHRAVRLHNVKQDRQLAKLLSFTGRGE